MFYYSFMTLNSFDPSMNLSKSIVVALLFMTFTAFPQELKYISLTIPDSLSDNANAVIRHNDLKVSIDATDRMRVSENRVITVLNKKGDRAVDAFVHYDNDTKIREIHAVIYNAFGIQIKKFKKGDFKDVSAVSGGTLYSDSRVKYLDYTPISYPYTVEFSLEVSMGSTAFLPKFIPIQDYFVSVESSSYFIEYPEDISIRKKEFNLKGIDVKSDNETGAIFYAVKNIPAYKPESYSPSIKNMTPKVFFASDKFSYKGVEAEATNWKDFGKWIYNDLLQEANDLPEATVTMAKDLVKNETSDIAKAKKIYQYLQDKTRYISVQVGIGGWKPYSAAYVDRLGYGDCKALTNYTMALLKAVGVEANYSVLYAGDSQMDIDKDFACMQGNHAFLTIPTEEGNIWLECTSQKVPFGFIGDFSDDRDVLVVSSQGGTIKHTKKYTIEENSQILKGNYAISNEGHLVASVNMVSQGIQYDDKFSIEDSEPRDRDMAYKERWKYINSLKIDNIQIENDKDSIQFKEILDFSAQNYCKIAGKRMLFVINALNRNRHVPNRYRNRTLPVKIKRGFVDRDEVEITLPDGYSIESLPKSKSIENKFGTYKTEISIISDNSIKYRREFMVRDGEYPKEDYTAFRNFYKEVSKLDNAKIALIKNKL